ncbi:hypothetical protein [Prochlorococcus sp. MIT 1223]|uniref:hypothetical protein n=1 Tax=Prochlorococcus sp. MIT 1223 TaxID=3096217 RepID=UPI002A753D99|nr:hypothetical protein [Prochlorococcus sp. MIT 1223]
MNQFLITFIAIALFVCFAVALLLLFVWSAKKTLIKGGTAWSAKDFPIKRNSSRSITQRELGDSATSLLESISDETKEYLKAEEENHNS